MENSVHDSLLLDLLDFLYSSYSPFETSTINFFTRSRLSYEQFGAFLANVKELNSHKQTKEVHHIYILE